MGSARVSGTNCHLHIHSCSNEAFPFPFCGWVPTALIAQSSSPFHATLHSPVQQPAPTYRASADPGKPRAARPPACERGGAIQTAVHTPMGGCGYPNSGAHPPACGAYAAPAKQRAAHPPANATGRGHHVPGSADPLETRHSDFAHLLVQNYQNQSKCGVSASDCGPHCGIRLRVCGCCEIPAYQVGGSHIWKKDICRKSNRANAK